MDPGRVSGGGRTDCGDSPVGGQAEQLPVQSRAEGRDDGNQREEVALGVHGAQAHLESKHLEEKEREERLNRGMRKRGKVKKGKENESRRRAEK